MHFWSKICSISRPLQFLLPAVSLTFGAPFVDNFIISGTFPYHFVDHLIMLLLKISWSSLTKHFLDVSWQFLPILFIHLRLFPGHLRSSYTISWPLYDNFLPFHDHWRRLKAIFLTISNHLLSIFRLFPGGFPTSSQPFPLQAIFVNIMFISRTIPNLLSSFGPFPDHLTPFRAVSWPFEAVTWSFQAVSWPIHDHSCRFLTISGHFRATSVTFLPFILAIFTQFLTI